MQVVSAECAVCFGGDDSEDDTGVSVGDPFKEGEDGGACGGGELFD